jgi:YfiH family protein
MGAAADWRVPDWPAPAGVRALFTPRAGGVSPPPWGAAPGVGGGLNLGPNTGDAPDRVQANRAILRRHLPAEPRWLSQVHGAQVVDADDPHAAQHEADASCALQTDTVCAVLVADCLPVLLAEVQGRAVAAAHAGWRGLAAGVLQGTVDRMRARLAAAGAGSAAEVIAWLGPAIGPQRFEVGAEVLAAMQVRLPQAAQAFVPARDGKYLADLYALARQALAQAGVGRVYGGDLRGGDLCTASDPQHFFSYRRDGRTGRHAALIWRSSAATDVGTGS